MNYRHKAPTDYYTVDYEHTYYDQPNSVIARAVYFQLHSAQEAMMKMIHRGIVVTGLSEHKLSSVRTGTP